MDLNNVSNIRRISLILYCLQLCIYLCINLLEMNFWGALAYTVGNSLITIITYILLYKGKISTVGGIIGIVLQLMSSVGTYMGKYVKSEPENYFARGLAIGCLVNVLFVISAILLITISSGKLRPSAPSQTPYTPMQSNQPSTHFAPPQAPQYHTQAPQYQSQAKINFCRQCGAKIIEGSSFCNKCGTKLDWN